MGPPGYGPPPRGYNPLGYNPHLYGPQGYQGPPEPEPPNYGGNGEIGPDDPAFFIGDGMPEGPWGSNSPFQVKQQTSNQKPSVSPFCMGLLYIVS